MCVRVCLWHSQGEANLLMHHSHIIVEVRQSGTIGYVWVGWPIAVFQVIALIHSFMEPNISSSWKVAPTS